LLFGDGRAKAALRTHLDLCAEIALSLGATRLVFGAPKNRLPGTLSRGAAFVSAVDFFREVGDAYHRQGVVLCLEPNPPQYGCEFITTTSEAARLVEAVRSPGFRLHLDTACMMLAGDDATICISQNARLLSHFHVSEPSLAPFCSSSPVHAAALNTLQKVKYEGYIVLEMRAGDPALDVFTRSAKAFVEKCSAPVTV
jgi:sugar phosphate isomerase/epimerase